MDTRTIVAAAIAAAMIATTVSLFAAEGTAESAARKSEPIYGYRMMNDQERNEFRDKMRNAGSADERQALRDEHRKQMEARAKERGVTLPEPRGPGGGKGPGYGSGPRGEGMGPGYGNGPRGEGKGPGFGPGGGKGPGYGPGARGDCPAGQDCPRPGAGNGAGPGQ